MIALNIDTSLNNYAVFGNPVKHSKSPQIHSLFAKQTGITLFYQAIEIPLNSFNKYVYAFFEQGGKGLNITVPFKEQAFKLCTKLTERAKLAESVNTLWFEDDLIISGDTTDGYGLIHDLVGNYHLSLKDKSILILGAGGTVKSIIEPLLEQSPKQLIIANRTISKADKLVKQFSRNGNIECCAYDDLTAQSFNLVINGTSLSLQGKLPPLPTSLLKHNACCYDLMYSNGQTVFMQWAKQNGAALVLDGLGMLVEQAAESFGIWHNIKPDTDVVTHVLKKD